MKDIPPGLSLEPSLIGRLCVIGNQVEELFKEYYDKILIGLDQI